MFLSCSSMDLSSATPSGMLAPSYNFEAFEEEVSKDSGDLTVDSRYMSIALL